MKRNIINAVLICLFVILGISTALLVYLHFFASGDRDLSGEWTADLDMTQRAAVVALDWLQDIEGVSVSMEEMESYMPYLAVQINLTMEQTARFGGTFRCNVQADSYDTCRQAAYEAFAVAFRDLLGERLRMAGYEGDTDQESVEALIEEAFGMSTVSYLMSCGSELLPPLEDLQARYDGSGTYEADEGILVRRFDSGGTVAVRTEDYIRKDSMLILSGEADTVSSGDFGGRYPVIYMLK